MTAPHEALLAADEAVLVVIDVQDGLADVMPRRDEAVAAASRLVRAFGVLGVPVLVTRQYPKGLGDTVGVVRDAYASLAEGLRAGVVDKTAFCCCTEPGFESALEATGRDHVVLAGMETHICVAQTALALLGGGSRVQVVADAVCSRRDLDHDTALRRLRAAGATVTTSEAVMYEALGRAGTPAFRQLLAIVKDA